MPPELPTPGQPAFTHHSPGRCSSLSNLHPSRCSVSLLPLKLSCAKLGGGEENRLPSLQTLLFAQQQQRGRGQGVPGWLGPEPRACLRGA